MNELKSNDLSMTILTQAIDKLKEELVSEEELVDELTRILK